MNINSNVGKMKRKWKCDRRLGRNLIHHLQRLNQIVDGLKKEKKKKRLFLAFHAGIHHVSLSVCRQEQEQPWQRTGQKFWLVTGSGWNVRGISWIHLLGTIRGLTKLHCNPYNSLRKEEALISCTVQGIDPWKGAVKQKKRKEKKGYVGSATLRPPTL